MDIKAQIEKVVEMVTKDKSLLTQFQAEPVKAVEKVIGIDLPDEIINKVVDGVKSKITVDKLSDTFDAIKKLFESLKAGDKKQSAPAFIFSISAAGKDLDPHQGSLMHPALLSPPHRHHTPPSVPALSDRNQTNFAGYCNALNCQFFPVPP